MAMTNGGLIGEWKQCLTSFLKVIWHTIMFVYAFFAGLLSMLTVIAGKYPKVALMTFIVITITTSLIYYGKSRVIEDRANMQVYILEKKIDSLSLANEAMKCRKPVLVTRIVKVYKNRSTNNKIDDDENIGDRKPGIHREKPGEEIEGEWK